MQKITKRSDGSVRVQTVNSEKSLTQQQFKDECDINNIMKKYEQTGEFLHLTKKQGQYADFSEIQDYQAMYDTVIKAEEAFMTLPAETRLRFQNNPGKLIEFIQDEKNYEEGVKLGILNKRPEKNDDLTTIKTDAKNEMPKKTSEKSSEA